MFDEVLNYLRMKNQFYEKFYTITAKFIDQASKNQWEDIESFVDNRERILNIIRSFDVKIGECLADIEKAGHDISQFKVQVKELLEVRGQLVNKIMNVDLDLINRMEELRVDTIRELKKNVEVSSHLDSFASNSPRHLAKTRKDA